MTGGSLFSGIGGFDKGFSLAGIESQWACEIEPACRRILRRHWPEVPIFEDVRECGAHNLGPVDVISFGSPCQDLSIAGKRDGLEGKRSSLFYEAIRICGELRPSFAVWENVPGALSSNDGRDFAAILAAFRECGARDIAWRVLDSWYFGVAQRRRRVFVVADFRGERAAEILLEPQSLRGDFEARGEARQVAPTLPSSGAGVGRTGNERTEAEFLVARTLGGGSGNRGWCNDLDRVGAFIPAVAYESGTGWVREGTRSLRAERRGDEHFVVAAPLTARGGKGGFTDPVNDNVLALDWQSGGDVQANISDRHSSALQSCQTPAVMLKRMVRRLTPVECERLQGFPDGWTEGESDSARYRALGNAITVNVAHWIGRRLKKAFLLALCLAVTGGATARVVSRPSRSDPYRIPFFTDEVPSAHKYIAKARILTVKASAYNASCRRCQTTGRTTTGRSASLPGVAVDPRFIRLGSRVRILSRGYSHAWRRVDDTGGGIRGRHIDVRVPTHKQAVRFGVRSLLIEVRR